jgi:hypothetical protein
MSEMTVGRIAFTPGPWHVGPHYKSDIESRFGRIAECGVTRGPQAEADAQLIAAAPDLLSALYYILEHSGDPVMENVARAAIAKAEGR